MSPRFAGSICARKRSWAAFLSLALASIAILLAGPACEAAERLPGWGAASNPSGSCCVAIDDPQVATRALAAPGSSSPGAVLVAAASHDWPAPAAWSRALADLRTPSRSLPYHLRSARIQV